MNSLAPRHRFNRHLVAADLGAVEHSIGSHVGRHGREHLLLAIYKAARIERRYFEAMPVSDGISGAGFHAISAENAAVVIDVIDLGVALSAAYTVGLSILRSLDVNAIGGAGRRA